MFVSYLLIITVSICIVLLIVCMRAFVGFVGTLLLLLPLLITLVLSLLICAQSLA